MAIIKEKSKIINVEIEKVVKILDNYIRKDINLFREITDIKEESFYIELNVKKSLASNGEIIKINGKSLDKNKTKLNITSESIIKKTLVDWGKNKRNVDNILNLFKDVE